MYRSLLFVLLLIFIGLQYRLWFGEASKPDLWRLRMQIDQQQAENEQLRERNERLDAEVLDLKQGFSALEERARSELGMVGKGETFYQLVVPEKERHQRD